MTVKEFIKAYKGKKFINTQQGMDERVEWLKSTLGVKEYIPFAEKRKIAEMIVAQNITEADGIKKYDSINGYISLAVASIVAHTTLEFSEDPVADYDLLAESGLLSQIIAVFHGSHEEIGIILKMALEMELEDNNVNVLIGRFLNEISEMLGDAGDVLKVKLKDLDLSKILGADFKQEDLAKLSGFLNKFK